MDWTVNDGLYHRFLKWRLKCENILECELAALPERQQCKKVIAWSGDFGMDQYVSWGLPTDQLTLEIIWGKFEDFCKPQSNEVRARFDLLTSFRQGNRSVDEWYNAVQAQVNLAKYPPETAKILQRDIFWFFLRDEEFVSKTISDGSVDLEKFPTSKVRQLAKKLESSKATARHIKQVAGDPQAAQINLLRHQRTELPAGKYKKKRPGIKPRQSSHKHQGQEGYHAQAQPKKRFDARGTHNDKSRCSKCGDSVHVEGFQCPAKKYQCKACHKFGHFTSMCFQKKQAPNKHRKPKAHQIQASGPNAYRSASYDHSDEDCTSEDSFCLQLKIKRRQLKNGKVPKATHLITNLAYRLQPHHHRNQYLRARLDTCADVNLMPASVYQLIYKDPQMKKLTPSNLQIGTYTTDAVQIVGSCTFHLVHPDTKKLLETTFYVAKNEGSVLLSCKTTLQLGLIQPRARLDYLPPRASLITSSADHPKKTKEVLHTQKKQVATQKGRSIEAVQPPAVKEKGPKLITSKEMIIREYPDVFQGIGKFPGPDYHIQLDPSVPPKQTPCRPIPIHLKAQFQQEISKMLEAGVLKPVHEATPWINSFVLVESKDKLGNLKLRICLDPTNLNKAIVREPYHFRTPEDIAHLLAEACIMTVCDCKKGYWHQKLDEASSYLTTFNTELGRYRYTVMPFGITVAGDVFQRKLDQHFGQIDQVIVIADDIMVVGNQSNHRDHDIALTNLLATARKSNIRLNYDKLAYKKTEVEFFGETYTTDGRKPAQSKVTAIVEMPPPTSKKQVQSFIGMINYLSKFSARLSELAEPIRELCKDKVPFNWGPEHQAAFKLMKREIIRAPVLAYYNPKKETILQTDASIKGLGACLLQDHKPVYFASKALTETQRGYVAIELESLAVAWAMEKFHHFLYASHFILETDQKPLEAILSKSLNQATPRLQRILIRTFPYTFTVRYIPGPTNQLADCLSRLGDQNDAIKLPKLHVNQITRQLQARSDSLQQLRMVTQADDELAILKHTIMQGWPKNIKQVPPEIQPYWTFREELTIEDGLILKGTRIVIPTKQHQAVLKQLHEGHLGLNKCKLRAKDTVYWPGLNAELENLVLNCALCLKYSTSKRKLEPSFVLGQEIPLYPWTKLATDIFHFEGVSYLLLVDYTSRYPVVRKLASMTGQHVASHFKLICSEYGWPDTLVSDNGPCYTSEVFTNLMREYNINHITSSPHYPQSNGLAEKYVQIVKNLFYKAQEEGKDLYHSLMVYRNTPLSSNLQSPMQILASRSARSDLPMSNAARKQKGLDCEQLRAQYKNEQLPSHDLHLDQAVMYQDPSDKRWYPATITRLCQEPRSYIITTKEGVQYRKTQAHLKLYHLQGEDKLFKQENHKRTVHSDKKQTIDTSIAKNRVKRDIKPPTRLDL